MRSLNKVQLIGNLGDDVKVTSFDSGSKVARISLATNEDYVIKETGEMKKNTVWHSLSAWDKTAELIEKYTKKGDKLYVECKLAYRTKDLDDGKKQYITEVRVVDFMNLTKKEAEENAQ